MGNITYHDVKQNSPEWLALREGKYTGSNADKLLSSMNVAEYAKAVISSFSTFWTKRGHLLEEEALKIYGAITGHEVTTTGGITNTDYPLAFYSPDGLVGKDHLLEVKCFSPVKHRLFIAGNVPIKILAQIHFGLLISGRKQATLIAYCPKRDENGVPIFAPKDQLVIIPIKRDMAIQRNFASKLKKLEEYVSKTQHTISA